MLIATKLDAKLELTISIIILTKANNAFMNIILFNTRTLFFSALSRSLKRHFQKSFSICVIAYFSLIKKISHQIEEGDDNKH